MRVFAYEHMEKDIFNGMEAKEIAMQLKSLAWIEVTYSGVMIDKLYQRPLLLTWIIWNPSMDKSLHAL